MRKTWRKISRVSFVIILLELVVMAVLFLPFYMTQRVFDSIDEGRYDKAQSYYESLPGILTSNVDKNLDNYAKFVCQEYIEGKRTYLEAIAALDAINAITGDKDIYDKYAKDLSEAEFKAALKLHLVANEKVDGSLATESKDRADIAMLRIPADRREELLAQLLNESYADFLDYNVTIEQYTNYAAFLKNYAYYDAYEYADVMKANATYVYTYRCIYDAANMCYNEKNYIGAAYLIKGITPDPKDTDYVARFADFRETLNTTASEYFDKKFTEYIKAGDKLTTISLLADIQNSFGDDLPDFSSRKKELLGDWQIALCDLLDETDIGKGEYNGNTFDTIGLYDVNKDGKPEAFFYNYADTANSYTHAYMFAFNGSDYVFIVERNWINLGGNGYLVAYPGFSGGGEQYQLDTFNGSSYAKNDNVQGAGGAYKVNGQETDYYTFLSYRTNICSFETEYSLKSIKKSDITEAEKFVMLFGD